MGEQDSPTATFGPVIAPRPGPRAQVVTRPPWYPSGIGPRRRQAAPGREVEKHGWDPNLAGRPQGRTDVIDLAIAFRLPKKRGKGCLRIETDDQQFQVVVTNRLLEHRHVIDRRVPPLGVTRHRLSKAGHAVTSELFDIPETFFRRLADAQSNLHVLSSW